jgi:hypothetical protein
MKSNRNLSRGEGRRVGNVALIAFMLGSLLLLSLIRARFSPIGRRRLDLCCSCDLDLTDYSMGGDPLI